MVKKRAAKKKTARRARRPRTAPLTRSGFDPTEDTGPLDAALYVTIAGETALQLVEYVHAPPTQLIQNFVVQIQEVSARPSDAVHDAGSIRYRSRGFFMAADHREMPYKRVIGRVLHELLNYRSRTSCSGGDVYYVLLDELPEQLPEAHQQILTRVNPNFDRSLNPGRRTVDKRLKEMKGGTRDDGKYLGPALVETTSTTQGGAERGYRLTEDGLWLFDGWPELPDLIRGRSQGTRSGHGDEE